jgi:hypothetical protein
VNDAPADRIHDHRPGAHVRGAGQRHQPPLARPDETEDAAVAGGARLRDAHRAERAPATQVDELDPALRPASERQRATVRREREVGNELVAQPQRRRCGPQRERAHPPQPRPPLALERGEQRPVRPADRVGLRVDRLQLGRTPQPSGRERPGRSHGEHEQRRRESHTPYTSVQGERFRPSGRGSRATRSTPHRSGGRPPTRTRAISARPWSPNSSQSLPSGETQ